MERSGPFEQHVHDTVERFFSRKATHWSLFEDPLFAPILALRHQHLPAAQRAARHPDGGSLWQRLRSDSDVPEAPRPPADGLDPLLGFAAVMSKEWENPSSVENVITMPSDPAICGAMLGALVNPNLVYRDYSEAADDLEKLVIRQIATLVGYSPTQATGLFTQGGTFCNLYGYLLGIRKTLHQTRELGMEHAQDYRIINSLSGHYSNITNLSLLGVNLREKTVRIPVDRSNRIDLVALEAELRACFSAGRAVPAIMLTMGTTDTFGVDDVEAVVALRDALCAEHAVSPLPHVHVDSAVGWPLIFFNRYPFGDNPLGIPPQTLASLERYQRLFQGLRFADSFTVDFQKWGYVPYTSSLLMIRDRSDMDALAHDPDNFSYFEQEHRGRTHLQSTIECSRGACGVFGAYAGLTSLGVTGYQTILAHCLDNARYFRERLAEVPGAVLVTPDNHGPAVGFRLYDPATVSCPCGELDRERRPDAADCIAQNTAHHRALFRARARIGLFSSWVDFVAHSDYGPCGRYLRIPGEKVVFLNPRTTRRHIDAFIEETCALQDRTRA